MTKKWAVLGLALLAARLGYAAYPNPAEVEFLLNNDGNEATRKAQLGTQITQKKLQVMKAQYNFSTLGGAIGTVINLVDVDGKAAKIPKNAVIGRALFDVLTPLRPVSGALVPTMSVGITNQTDLYPLSGYTAYKNRFLGTPSGTSTLKTVTEENVRMTISGVAALGQGRMNVFIEYYLSDPNI